MDTLITLKTQYQQLKKEYEKAKVNNYNHMEQRILAIRLEQLEKNINFLNKKNITLPKIERNFSFLSYLDKKDLIEEIINIKTPYREILNINTFIPFGIEIEVTNIFLEDLKTLINGKMKSKDLKFPYEIHKEDTVCSVHYQDRKEYQGGEIVSPIFYNSKKTWKDIRKLCSILKENHIKISETCSIHTHVGAEILDYNENTLRKVIKLFIIYEHVLFRFFLGNYFSVRDIRFAIPLREKLLQEEIDYIDTMSLYDLKKRLTRSVALNICNFDPTESYKKNTIEMRLGNGTLNEQIIQNYIMATICFLESVNKPGRLDFYLEDKLKKLKENSYYYTDLALEDAFELCDFIFEKEEDKIYFLKQYLHKLEPAKKSNFPTPLSGQPKKMMLK